MTTDTKPFHERHLMNLLAALRQCPQVDDENISFLVEAAKADLQAWMHHLVADWSKDFDLVEKRSAA